MFNELKDLVHFSDSEFIPLVCLKVHNLNSAPKKKMIDNLIEN